jgi:hypothetical protein
LVLVVRVA